VQLSQGEKLGLLWAAMVVIVIFLAFAIACPAAHAQEVIMNIPSADVPNAGHVFVRSDSFYTQHPAFFMENFNVAVGLGHGLEASINGTGLAHYNYPISVVPGVKYAFYRGKSLTLYAGDQLTRPVRNTPYDVGNFTYAGAAYKVGSFRFTGGAWQSVNAVALGQRAGGMGGIEYMTKPLYKGWMLGPGFDYASGAGTNGYASPGLMFMKGNFFACPGYMIANSKNPNGAHQSFVMVGYTF
jgi:hypothetical protein